ncbi:hypothetical protein HMF8227_00726 [Saliniradius amylolyticus]|uniref:Sulfotransferase family protein n=1 Tax=Saliniradius amylolyticus TaxID=2183582 RepID=A0A2S2E113_9ALTE|nr:hypothetical protein [Saliniradius amylolyticus]AWL11222.1 hypothetical protein HMF8227_00726 [Saliniradius amylolyticus]
MKKYNDPRVFVDQGNKKVIVANLKCGYSTINQFYKNQGVNVSHDFEVFTNQNDFECVIFVREPWARFKSFYKNWVIDKQVDESYSNMYLYNIFKRAFSENFFKSLCSSTVEKKSSSEFFNVFFEQFSGSLSEDRHTVRQVDILKEIDCSSVSNLCVYDFKDNQKYLESLYNVSPVIQNETGSCRLNIKLNKENQKTFNSFYSDDFQLYEKSERFIDGRT